MKNLKKCIIALTLTMMINICGVTFAADVILYDTSGVPSAVVDVDNQSMIYLSSGQAVGYVSESGQVYNFNGKHLGWYSDGVLWDQNGYMVAFVGAKKPSSIVLQNADTFVVTKGQVPTISPTRENVTIVPSYIYETSPMTVRTYFGY